MRIAQIHQEISPAKKAKRVGRGYGSKRGGKSGRGQKGQKSRTGFSFQSQFEGGQTSFIQKVPKLKGFKNPSRIAFQVINLSDLERIFDEGSEVTLVSLAEKNLIRKKSLPVKLLANGKITKKLTVEVDAASAKAKEAVEKAGGSLKVVTA
ncbi:MAG: 50S ribosomal protein L15 [Candidatus Gracilibacteria bacterium]